MQNPKIVRQGDVLLVPISEIPKGVQNVPSEVQRLVLAKGEVTGHHHSIACSPNVHLLKIPSQDELFLLVKQGDALLEHQEHAAITIPPGTYRVVRQREYTPQEIRQIAD